MPAYKKKHIASNSTQTTPACSSPNLPEQQEFHHHLRELIRGATRVVMEEIRLYCKNTKRTTKNGASPFFNCV